MFNYNLNTASPITVEAENVFERLFLEFNSAEIAQEWHTELTTALKSVLERTLGSKCEICFGRLQPAYCCHCMKCDRICCADCCGYINSQDRKTSSKNMACLSCLSFNEKIMNNNTDVKKLIEKTNNNQTEFLQPAFVRHQVATRLPAGWEACMLADSRVYFFNRALWLSSWSLPQEDWENDAPYGWQKYFNEKKMPFYYRTTDQSVQFDRPLKEKELTIGCPGCDYFPTKEQIKEGHCPCCNSSLFISS